MSKIVDARGLSCPQPVILAMKAIQEGTFPIDVMVDTVTSRENVSRMAKKSGCRVDIRCEKDEFTLTITK